MDYRYINTIILFDNEYACDSCECFNQVISQLSV